MRKFNIGDYVVCMSTGVFGKVIKFYTPTSTNEQTMVLTIDERLYHAPTYEWKLVDKTSGFIEEESSQQPLLNAYLNLLKILDMKKIKLINN